MDCYGGGSSTEALIGIAIGVMEAGLLQLRGDLPAMNGFSQVRIGGTGARAAAPVSGDMLHNRAYGFQSAGQMFAPSFMRHMYDYGTRPEQVAMVKVVHSEHASNNPKAYYKAAIHGGRRAEQQDHLQTAASADCCVETDNGTAIIVTRAYWAKDMRHTPALIRGIVGRCSKPRMDMHYQAGPIARVGGYYAKDILWPMPASGPRIST